MTITDVIARIWIKKYVLIIWMSIGIILGITIALSIPKTYTTTLKMVPESTESATGTSAALAALGVGAGISSEDAYNPSLYPDIVSSIPFITSLFDVEIQTTSSDTTYTLRDYIEFHTKSPWWSNLLSSEDDAKKISKSPNEIIDPFRLTAEENSLYHAISNSISTSVDKVTAEVTINVTMQDPLVAAQLTDTIAAHLQEYITDYRTAKARHDLDYAIEINEEAKKQYYEAQQTYADYMDRNQGLALYSAQTTRDRLQNEMQLAFNLYNQTSQRVQQCEATVQEVTPVFAVVNPATVPIWPSGPKKTLIVVLLTFVTTIAGILQICYSMFFSRTLRNKVLEQRAIINSRKEANEDYISEDTSVYADEDDLSESDDEDIEPYYEEYTDRFKPHASDNDKRQNNDCDEEV